MPKNGIGQFQGVVRPLANCWISFPDHLKKVKAVHQQDVADGWGCVQLPDALDRKYPNAPKDWRWQWVFPQEHRWRNLQTKKQSRHHID